MKSVNRNLIKCDFTQIPNGLLRDKRLSFKARGIMAMILTHHDGWDVSQEWIAQQGTEGREAVASAFRELEQLGYCAHGEHRNEQGRIIGHVWTFYWPALPEAERTNRTRWKNGNDIHDTASRVMGNHPTASQPTASPRLGTGGVQNIIASEYNPQNKGAEAALSLEGENGRLPGKREKATLERILEVPIPSVLLNGGFKDAWAEWLTWKFKECKQPIKRMSAEKQLKALAILGSERAIKAIEHSISNGYQGIFEPRTTNTKTKQTNEEDDRYSHLSASNRACSNRDAVSQYQNL